MSCCGGPRRWMRRKTTGTARTSAATSCRRSWPFERGGWGKIREAMAALQAEAQAAAEPAAEEGKDHPGVPDDRAQRNFTDPESRIMPGPGGRDFLQAYNCQGVVDSEHQVIVAARATNQTSDKQQAVVMIEETIDKVGAVPRSVPCPGRYPPTPVTTRQGRWRGYRPWGWTPTSRRKRPATGTDRRPRPGGAYPITPPPKTGCVASCRPGGVVSAMRCVCRRWNRYLTRSSRPEGSGSSCCEGWRRSTANGR